MPKKKGKGKKSISEREKRLEKEFLRQLKTIESDERNQVRKGNQKRGAKTPPNKRVKPPDNADRSGRNRTPSKLELVRTSKKQPEEKRLRVGKGKGEKRIEGSVEITRTKRTDQKIHITFKNVRSVKNKIRLLNGSDVDKVLINQFKRKGGLPPLGLVVTVTDKNGVSASDVAPDMMVINRANVKEFAERFLKSLEQGNKNFRSRNYTKKKKRKKKRGFSNDEIDEGGGGYDEYNPEGIQTITIKFIYGKD